MTKQNKPEAVEVEPVAYRHRDGMLSCRLPGGGVQGIDWTPLYEHAPDSAARIAELERWHELDTKQIDYLLVERATLTEKLRVAREALVTVEGMLDEIRDYPITHDLVIEALAIIGEEK